MMRVVLVECQDEAALDEVTGHLQDMNDSGEFSRVDWTVGTAGDIWDAS
jgi:hypothetical protein